MAKRNLAIPDDKKLEILRLYNDEYTLSQISSIVGISRSTVYRFLNKLTYKDWWEENGGIPAQGTLYDHHHSIKRMEGKRFIISSAQTNTYVHKKFLSALHTASDHLGAEILISTFTYNTNEFAHLSKQAEEWIDPLIEDYIVNEPVILADGLIFCGELNILPTAVNPLSGFHSYTKGSSGIIPHAKMQMESLPVLKGEAPRFLYTTGTVTQRNYVQKKAGQKASFHHIFGALLVEVDEDGDWFVRQIIADGESGEFYDLDTLYTPTSVVKGVRVEGINYGDIHSEKIDQEAAHASFGSGDSMLNVLRPKYQIVHDVFDMDTRNHHNTKDPYFRFEKHISGEDSVEGDIVKTVKILEKMHRDFCQTVVVESNHDLALRRWLRTADYRDDPANALFFLECQLETYKRMKEGDKDFSVFQYAIQSRSNILDDTIFLRTDESFKLCGQNGIECGMHGHLGINGARGTVQAFARLGIRSNVGHSHTARIYDGVYQGGTLSKLDMGYNEGPTTWSHSNIVTYPNSKRTIVTIKNGKWRA